MHLERLRESVAGNCGGHIAIKNRNHDDQTDEFFRPGCVREQRLNRATTGLLTRVKTKVIVGLAIPAPHVHLFVLYSGLLVQYLQLPLQGRENKEHRVITNRGAFHYPEAVGSYLFLFLMDLALAHTK